MFAIPTFIYADLLPHERRLQNHHLLVSSVSWWTHSASLYFGYESVGSQFVCNLLFEFPKNAHGLLNYVGLLFVTLYTLLHTSYQLRGCEPLGQLVIDRSMFNTWTWNSTEVIQIVLELVPVGKKKKVKLIIVVWVGYVFLPLPHVTMSLILPLEPVDLPSVNTNYKHGEINVGY